MLPSHQETEKKELWSWILHTIWLCGVFRQIKKRLSSGNQQKKKHLHFKKQIILF